MLDQVLGIGGLSLLLYLSLRLAFVFRSSTRALAEPELREIDPDR
jgi:hypothetical protein